MKKIMMTAAAIVCCMVVQAQSIREDWQAHEENVNVLSNAIVAAEAKIAEYSNATNIADVAKSSLITAEKGKIKVLTQQLEAARELASKVTAETKLFEKHTEIVITKKGETKIDISDFSTSDLAEAVYSRYTKGKKIYANKWFSSKDDVINNTTLKAIDAQLNATKKAELLLEYMYEQL